MSAQNEKEQDMQWLRACGLVVGGKTGQGLDLSGLRIKFSTKKGDTETPNSAEITVYNLSEDTSNRIGREFSRVLLSAGYESNNGLVFDGNIRQVLRGRENGTDSVTTIIAADGDAAYNNAVINQTLAAGSKPGDQVKACQQTFAAKGAGAGHTPELEGPSLPRGKVMYGMSRKYMRDVAKGTDTTWSIQDGKVQMVKVKGYLPGEAVVLTSETGLIGTPEQTQDGIKCQCLINPRLRIGGRIWLNNKSVQRVKTDLKMAAANTAPRLDQDGFYRILTIELDGDTHGQPWYANLVTIGIDDTSRLPLDMAKR